MTLTGRKASQSRERIVEAASRALRRSGVRGVSVAEIMKEAGLTHGGFYAHFPSRDALVSEALGHAGAASLESIGGQMAHLAKDAGVSPFRALVQTYTSGSRKCCRRACRARPHGPSPARSSVPCNSPARSARRPKAAPSSPRPGPSCCRATTPEHRSFFLP
jgi:AcrR family transcriptional regulator